MKSRQKNESNVTQEKCRPGNEMFLLTNDGVTRRLVDVTQQTDQFFLFPYYNTIVYCPFKNHVCYHMASNTINNTERNERGELKWSKNKEIICRHFVKSSNQTQARNLHISLSSIVRKTNEKCLLLHVAFNKLLTN